VTQGGKVICSPASKIYLDMKYDEACPLGLTWSGTVNTQQSYEWEPATLMAGVSEADIIGLEAPLWTETIQTRADIEYMIFPRLLGMAEIGWSPILGRSWEDYRIRLAAHAARLEALGIHFYRDPTVDWR
jgi:hexosaminidase